MITLTVTGCPASQHEQIAAWTGAVRVEILHEDTTTTITWRNHCETVQIGMVRSMLCAAAHIPSPRSYPLARRRPCLSVREEEVLLEWLRSDSKEVVARHLHIEVCTVNTFLDRIRGKYAEVGRPAPTKAALVARAIQDGLVDADDL